MPFARLRAILARRSAPYQLRLIVVYTLVKRSIQLKDFQAVGGWGGIGGIMEGSIDVDEGEVVYWTTGVVGLL